MKVIVIRPDPYSPKTSVIIPALAQRVIDYAKENLPWTDAQEFVKGVMSRIWAGDPATLLVALVNEEGVVMGHLLASLGSDGKKIWCSVAQYRADGPVGDAGLIALDYTYRWAAGKGAKFVTLNAIDANVAKWRERGFSLAFQVLHKSLETDDAP